VGHVAANHAADDPVFADVIFLDVEGFNDCPISDDRDDIGNFDNFVQFMRDQNRRNPLLLEIEQQFQQVVAVSFIEGCSWFIKDQDLDIFGKGFGDFDQLLLADADVLDQGVRVFSQTNRLEQLASFGNGCVPVDDRRAAVSLPRKMFSAIER